MRGVVAAECAPRLRRGGCETSTEDHAENIARSAGSRAGVHGSAYDKRGAARRRGRQHVLTNFSKLHGGELLIQSGPAPVNGCEQDEHGNTIIRSKRPHFGDNEVVPENWTGG